jgi:hypothetical protein
MKKTVFLVLVTLLVSALFAEEFYKPYILGATSSKSLQDVINILKTNMEKNDLQILGEYTPAADENRYILVFTSDIQKSIVEEFGGLRGFFAALRIGLTHDSDLTEISFTNPNYWGLAYLGEDFDIYTEKLESLTSIILSSLSEFENPTNQPFGSEKGLKTKKLKNYRYMMGMPKFDDVVTLAEFENYEQAINTIHNNLNKANSQKVYEIDFPSRKLALFGIALSGENGESEFLPKIDIDKPKHTAFLPYEMLVDDNKVYMLHGRFRIALSFPDLSMGTFMKIMSTPGDIEKMLKSFTE